VDYAVQRFVIHCFQDAVADAQHACQLCAAADDIANSPLKPQRCGSREHQKVPETFLCTGHIHQAALAYRDATTAVLPVLRFNFLALRSCPTKAVLYVRTQASTPQSIWSGFLPLLFFNSPIRVLFATTVQLLIL
jgi:hypothetical protein